MNTQVPAGGSIFSWRRLRWWLLVAGIALVVNALGIMQPQLLKTLGVHPINPPFADLIAILAAGETHAAGLNAYANNPLDPLNRPHVYGPWWLVIGQFGAVRADAWWLGLLLAGSFLAVVVGVLNPRNVRTTLMSLVWLASPPVLLALERGNNDLVIFILFAIAVWLVTRPAPVAPILAGGLLVLAAALKLYPLVALPALASRPVARSRAWWMLGGTAAICIIVLLSALADYQRTLTMAPEPFTIFGYGAKLSHHLLQTLPQQRGWVLAGGLPVILFTLWASWRWWRSFWTLLPTTGLTTGCYLAGALSWSLCYVTTINFPYRLVLLLLPARLWLEYESTGRINGAIRFQWLVTSLLLWTPCFKEHLLVPNADESRYTGTAATWMALGVEHALAFAITGTLGVMALGWMWRRFANPTAT